MRKVFGREAVDQMIDLMTFLFANNASASGKFKKDMINLSNSLWQLKDTIDSMEDVDHGGEDFSFQEEKQFSGRG